MYLLKKRIIIVKDALKMNEHINFGGGGGKWKHENAFLFYFPYSEIYNI